MQLQKLFENLPWKVKGPAGLCGAIVGHFADKLPPSLEPYAIIGGFGLFAWVIAAFLWHAINHWRVESGKTALMLEPWHIITLGLVIAAGGLLWQWRHAALPDPQIAVLQSQVDALKQQVSVPKPAPQVQQPVAQTTPLKPMLTEYDVTRRQKIIDEILDFLDGRFMSINVSSEKLRVRIWEAIGTRAAVPELKNQADTIVDARDGYFPLIGRYTNFADIYSAAFDTSGWEPGMLAQSATNLRQELEELEQHGQTEQAQNVLKNNTMMAKWQEDNSKLWPWINERKERLFALRKKYEQAEVYPHGK